MSGEVRHPLPSMLERLDLALAKRLASIGLEAGPIAAAECFQDGLQRVPGGDAALIGALLRLRGFVVFDDDVVEVLAGRSCRLPAESQERSMALGLADVLQMVRDRARQGVMPDGWFLAETFKTMVRGVSRFRGRVLREDRPWDAVMYVNYPDPRELQRILDSFHFENRYRDAPSVFDRLHPVRQSFRVLWRMCRVAPFFDLNLLMGWLGMCAYLLGKGYPLIKPEDTDRHLMHRMVSGPPPLRIVQFESRLLGSTDS